MPILGELNSFPNLVPAAIGKRLLKKINSFFETSSEPVGANAFVLRLEAYLDLTNQHLDFDELKRPSWKAKWRGFAGALATERFSTFQEYATFNTARRLLATIGDDSTLDLAFPTRGSDVSCPQLLAHKQLFESADLSPERVEFWNGWSARNKRQEGISFRFHTLHRRLGGPFCNSLLIACRGYVRGRNIQRIPCVNELADYLSIVPGEIVAADFQRPDFVEHIISQFMLWYFRTGEANGTTLNHLFTSWSTFVHFLEEQVLAIHWAMPTCAVPRPEVPRVSGARTHTKTKGGIEFKYKLLTEVPLTTTDQEAIELLWREIRRDVELITAWARAEADCVWNRRTRRTALAETGIACVLGETGTNNGNSLRLARSNPEHLAHAAATFEARGYVPGKDFGGQSQYYPQPLSQTAWELGLPSATTLLAHASILVYNHPELTPACLSNLELFDKHGHLIGYQSADAGHYLRGFKRRKGSTLAEQRILLNEESNEIVRRLIDLTQPLRDHLRAIGDDSWRLLFLSTASMGSKPRAGSIEDPTHERGALRDAIARVCGTSVDESRSLADRFTLQRLRSSCGVLVYLETQSVEKMAKALGHTRYSPQLLDRYLPRVLQQFFVERWIRIFQAGILCECLKDSPDLLLLSTGFKSLADATAFLELHALKTVPSHLDNPDIGAEPSLPATKQTVVVFCISTRILTVLLSLQMAVKRSNGGVSGQALRWFRIAEKLIPAIEADDLFLPLLHAARSEAAADIYEVMS